MRKSRLTDIAPEIYRKRLIIEGYFSSDPDEALIERFFSDITQKLGLRTYGNPIIHKTSGEGKEANEGFDGFVPLIDSGIYVAVWSNLKFMSAIVYTCADFDEDKAVAISRDVFELRDFQAALF